MAVGKRQRLPHSQPAELIEVEDGHLWLVVRDRVHRADIIVQLLADDRVGRRCDGDFRRRREWSGSRCRCGVEHLGEDHVDPVFEDVDPLDRLGQLPHVARPRVPHEAVERERIGLPLRAAILTGEVGREVLHEPGNVFRTGPQRWDIEVDRVEPVEQVFAEHARGDVGLEVAVGGCDHLHVDRMRFRRADRGDFPALQHAQEFRLEIQRQLPNLIEKNDAPLCGPEGATRSTEGARERPFLVAEELAFGEVGDEPATVDGDKRFVVSWACGMDRPGHFFLSTAGLARDQHGAVERCHPGDVVFQPADRLGTALKPGPALLDTADGAALPSERGGLLRCLGRFHETLQRGVPSSVLEIPRPRG